jgi:hypothetical protein
VVSQAPELAIQWEDWKGAYRIVLGPRRGGVRQKFELETAEPWRRHPFWWNPSVDYQVRVVRLSVGAPGGESVSARLYYLGDGESLEGVFQVLLEEGSLPTTAVAGEPTTLALAVRNMSPRPWSSEVVLPIRLGYRLFPQDPEQAEVEGGRVDLPRVVDSGDRVELELEVRWPEKAGVYRLTVDLLAENYAWFGTRVGRPLLEGRVEVMAPALDPPAPEAPGDSSEGR